MIILAVDDDDDDLEFFSSAVHEIDPSIQIVTASNGEEALKFLLHKAITLPDCVFLDLNMPRVNGRQCLAAMREQKITRHIPVIMYSTTLSDDDKVVFQKLNARFLIKPSGYLNLVASLKQMLGTLKAELSAPIQFPT